MTTFTDMLVHPIKRKEFILCSLLKNHYDLLERLTSIYNVYTPSTDNSSCFSTIVTGKKVTTGGICNYILFIMWVNIYFLYKTSKCCVVLC